MVSFRRDDRAWRIGERSVSVVPQTVAKGRTLAQAGIPKCTQTVAIRSWKRRSFMNGRATPTDVACHDSGMTTEALLHKGVVLERVTLGWNAVGIVVLGVAAVMARSVALAGFELDSLVEIGASTVVLWELAGTGEDRRRRALRLIGAAFVILATYIAVQSTIVLVTAYHAKPSVLGIGWTAITALAMFALASGKTRTGRALGNQVLTSEGSVTFVDGLLAAAVLIGLALNALAGAWWADPLAGFVIVFYGIKEAHSIFGGGSANSDLRN